MDGTHLWNLDGTYNIWMEPEHTQNGWNRFMFPNPPSDTLNWSVMVSPELTGVWGVSMHMMSPSHYVLPQ